MVHKGMTRVAGACLALLGALGVVYAGVPAEGALAPAMAAALEEEGLAGVAWGTVGPDGAIRTGAAGYRDLPARLPMRRDDRVQVGSVTKTLVATGVLQLASAGRVDLDAPVESLLPQVRFDNPWRDTHPVRVRHLLDHTAGLEDARWWQMFSAQATPDAPLADAFARDPGVLRIRTRPGERFSYSNMGYTLAAMVIEAATGERYERHLKRALLQPLGMRDSTFAFATQVGAARDARLAWGHQDDGSVHAAVPIALRPAGQFTTTVHDLALFARFLLGDGVAGGRVLVRPELLRAMARPHATAAAAAGLRSGYALGLARRDRHGVVGLCHEGSTVGYRAMLCLYPQVGQAFALVHNADKEGADYRRFDALMVEALRVPPTMPTRAAAMPADAAEWQGRYVPAPARFEPLRYLQMLTETVALTATRDHLRLVPLGGEARTLVPAGGHLFMADDRSAPSHALLRAGGERWLVRDGLRTWRRVPAAGYWLHWASVGAGVLGLAWFLLAAPVAEWRATRRPLRPGVVAAWSLLLPLPLFARQSLLQLGDATPASVALYVATLLLPLLMGWQAARSFRYRAAWRERAHLLAALAVLQWCAVLWAWGMLPHALWR